MKNLIIILTLSLSLNSIAQTDSEPLSLDLISEKCLTPSEQEFNPTLEEVTFKTEMVVGEGEEELKMVVIKLSTYDVVFVDRRSEDNVNSILNNNICSRYSYFDRDKSFDTENTDEYPKNISNIDAQIQFVDWNAGKLYNEDMIAIEGLDGSDGGVTVPGGSINGGDGNSIN